MARTRGTDSFFDSSPGRVVAQHSTFIFCGILVCDKFTLSTTSSIPLSFFGLERKTQKRMAESYTANRISTALTHTIKDRNQESL